MSQGNAVNWNELERVGSADLNMGETMSATTALMVAHALLYQRGDATNVTNALGPRVGNCVSGMMPFAPFIPNSTISIMEGTLFTWSPSVPAIPSSDTGFQSNFRMATTHPVLTGSQTTSVALPTPSVDPIWFVVCARVSATEVSGTRDIKDVDTREFVPTSVVVKKLVGVEYYVLASAEGASAFPDPLTLDPEWVPICGGRCTTAGAVSNVHDFRISPSAYLAQQANGLFAHRGRVDHDVNAGSISFRTVEPVRLMGMELSWTADASAVSNYLEPGLTLAASTNYYFYLTAPNFPITAHTGANGTGPNNAIVVLSDTTPVVGSNALGLHNIFVPQVAITAPALFANFFASGSIQTNQAVCIGCVRRNDANDGWVDQIQLNHRVSVNRNEWKQENPVPLAAPWTIDLAVPYMARRFRFSIHGDLTSSDATKGVVRFAFQRQSGWGPQTSLGVDGKITDSITTYVFPLGTSQSTGEWFFEKVPLDYVLGGATLQYDSFGKLGDVNFVSNGFWYWSLDSYEW